MKSSTSIAQEISILMPTFIRHMYPYVFQPMRLPPSQIMALVSVQEKNGCTQTQLRNDMHVSAPTITGIIDRLERGGYIYRRIDSTDRRVKNLVLTQKGKGVVRQFRHNIMKRWEYILSHVPNDLGPSTVNVLQIITKGFHEGVL